MQSTGNLSSNSKDIRTSMKTVINDIFYYYLNKIPNYLSHIMWRPTWIQL